MKAIAAAAVVGLGLAFAPCAHAQVWTAGVPIQVDTTNYPNQIWVEIAFADGFQCAGSTYWGLLDINYSWINGTAAMPGLLSVINTAAGGGYAQLNGGTVGLVSVNITGCTPSFLIYQLQGGRGRG